MISDNELNRALTMVRRSGVAAELEAQLRANTGGAPRILPVELLFAACILVNGRDYTTADLVSVHKLLTQDLVVSTQIRLGLARKVGTEVRKLKIHQVRYLFKRIRKMLDYSPHTGRVWGAGKQSNQGRPLTQDERLDREQDFLAYLGRLLEASSSPVRTTDSQAIDATSMLSPARARQHRKALEGEDYRLDDSNFALSKPKSHDQDARHGYHTATQEKGGSSIFFGFQLLTSCAVYERGTAESSLKLIQGMSLIPANATVAAPTLRMIDEMQSRQEVATILVDRGFSIGTAENWANRVLERGVDQVFDLTGKQRGARLDHATGALMIDGWPCVPWTPKHLHSIPRPPVFTAKKPGPGADKDKVRQYLKDLGAIAEFNALQAELEPYALASNGRRKPSGSRRFHTTGYQRERATAAQRRSKVFQKSTITIEATVLPHLRQEYRWGSPSWIAAYTQRGAVEGGYGNLKTLAGEGLKRGWIRLVGLTATGLMVAFAVMHYNLRILRKWAADNGRTGDDELLALDPVIFGYETVRLDANVFPERPTGPPLAA